MKQIVVPPNHYRCNLLHRYHINRLQVDQCKLILYSIGIPSVDIEQYWRSIKIFKFCTLLSFNLNACTKLAIILSFLSVWIVSIWDFELFHLFWGYLMPEFETCLSFKVHKMIKKVHKLNYLYYICTERSISLILPCDQK